jgi:hypothetical protein
MRARRGRSQGAATGRGPRRGRAGRQAGRPGYLDDEQVVGAAFAQEPGVGALGVQRVRGDHYPRQDDGAKQLGERGDLVALALDLLLGGQHPVVIGRGYNVWRLIIRILRAAASCRPPPLRADLDLDGPGCARPDLEQCAPAACTTRVRDPLQKSSAAPRPRPGRATAVCAGTDHRTGQDSRPQRSKTQMPWRNPTRIRIPRLTSVYGLAGTCRPRLRGIW